MNVNYFTVFPERPTRGGTVTLDCNVSDASTSTITYKVSTNPTSSTSWTTVSGNKFVATGTAGTIYYFKAIIGSYDTWDDAKLHNIAAVVDNDNHTAKSVPLVDIVFVHDETGGTSDLSKRTITIAHPVTDVFLSGGAPKGLSKMSRSLNKNVIYINFPAYTEDNGGYGYDLGFVEDTFTFTIITHDWDEYNKLFTLCKCNTGECSGYLHIGRISNFNLNYPYTETQYTQYGCKTYKVLVRSTDADFDPGTFKVTYTIKCTIVYNGA